MKRRSLIYSTGAKYAIRAAIFLARHPRGAAAQHIAAECALNPWFLRRILTRLAARRIVSSGTGQHAGFVLRRDASELRLADIVEAIDGEMRFSRCAMGYGVCPSETPCAMHESWQEVRASIDAYLRETSIADLASRADRLRSFCCAE